MIVIYTSFLLFKIHGFVSADDPGDPGAALPPAGAGEGTCRLFAQDA